jgi:hypothetical protein
LNETLAGLSSDQNSNQIVNVDTSLEMAVILFNFISDQNLSQITNIDTSLEMLIFLLHVCLFVCLVMYFV